MGALKTIFLIAITTTRMIFPGIPGISPVSNPDAETAPPPAVRAINFELMCEKNAIKTARADLKVPAGLEVGEAVKLEITRGETTDSASDDTSKLPDGFKAISYWGVGEAAAQGQPKVTDGTQTEQPVTFPDYPTHGQWPGLAPGYEGKEIIATAHAPGLYTLSSFCGDTSIELGPEQDFLAPIELIGLSKQADLDKPIKLQWKPVPNAVGYLLSAIGGNAKSSITWTSSAQPNPPLQIEYMPIKEADLKQYLDNKVLLPAETTTATIPAGIFQGSDSVFLTIIAVGKDKIVTKDGIETQVLVRSTACVPLHSKENPWN